MCIFRRKRHKPDIIDLVQYEKNQLYRIEHRTAPVRPPKTILPGDWTDAEMDAMWDNREKARNIYERLQRK